MKFYSDPVPEYEDAPLAEHDLWDEPVEEWDEPENEKAVYVVSVGEERDPVVRQAQLSEILALVTAQGGEVVGHEIVYLTKVRPRTLLGKGTSRAIADRARALGAGMLVLDAELSPSQTRNLEEDSGIKVCDREAIILNVFMKNARSRRARVQIEIARLEYLRPRIRGVGINMDQQMGGVTGSRGPGETRSELLARQLDSRLVELRKALKKVSTAGHNRRQSRDDCQRLALVGYTNAGKTALMNALTKEELSSRDSPFETLETTSRSLSRYGERVLISDTVGFIRRLPDRLLESFATTLAEVKEASLLVIVADISDPEWRDHLATTLDLLEQLAADGMPRYFVFNKADLLEEKPAEEILRQISEGAPFRVVSTRDPEQMKQLKESLLEAVRGDQIERTLFIPYCCSEALNLLYGGCRVSHTETLQDGLRISFQGPATVVARIEAKVALSEPVTP
ncbi:MAG: GTPase HflX [Vulcanimicrobiota bacterium]